MRKHIQHRIPMDLDRIYQVDIKGVFNTLQTGVEAMKAKGGAIVNISSIAAHVGLPVIGWPTPPARGQCMP